MLARVFILIAAAAAAGTLAACGSDAGETPAPASPGARVESGDALARLKADANQLLDGGPDAFKARLAELRGHPVVVNQWASWCGPCRFEFPFFQRLAEKYDGQLAFLGVDSRDSRGPAERFLKEFPVPYPHYYDQDARIARLFGGGRAWPTTAFYDSSGQLVFTHVGAYDAQGTLEGELRKYALGG
jgi:cytochrome c biogenesis protein CcmG, thiol:disulfide interchange protein DsbE